MSWFDVPTTQMPIVVLFVGAGVLFDRVFFSVSILKTLTLTVTVAVKVKLDANPYKQILRDYILRRNDSKLDKENDIISYRFLWDKALFQHRENAGLVISTKLQWKKTASPSKYILQVYMPIINSVYCAHHFLIKWQLNVF